MKINHENKNYVLDVDRAIELGVLKQKIEYKIGDVFGQGNTKCVIVESGHSSGRYSVIGLYGLSFYSNTNYSTPQEVGDYMINCGDVGFKYLGNINDDFRKLLKNFKGE